MIRSIKKRIETDTCTENELSEDANEVKNRKGLLKPTFSDDLLIKKQNAFKKSHKGNSEKAIYSKINNNFFLRAFWTIIMLLAFLSIVLAGNFYCTLLMFLINIGMVKEIVSVKQNKAKENHLPFSVVLNWYFFGVASFYFFVRVLRNKLARLALNNNIMNFILIYHEFISLIMWIIGFLMFILSLKKDYYRYQSQQFIWTHITLLIIVGQSSAIINNIYEGLIWFVLPALLVISNDTFTYIFGFFVGKTRLIELSPKKTWEGLIGGFLSTIGIAFLLSNALGSSPFLICPQNEFSFTPHHFKICNPHEIFNLYEYKLPDLPFLAGNSIVINQFQVHAMILGAFASLISPFGGLFALAFKKSRKIKEFADFIPGHGGITDRMKCQIFMGTFAYLYVSQIIIGTANDFTAIMSYIITEMTPQDQLLLYSDLKKILAERGLLNLHIQTSEVDLS